MSERVDDKHGAKAVLGVEVTPEMFAAGEGQLEQQGIALDPNSPPIDVGDVFRAMLSARSSTRESLPDYARSLLCRAVPYIRLLVKIATTLDHRGTIATADEIERYLKETLDAPVSAIVPIPLATGDHAKIGWTVDPYFIEKVREKAMEKWEGHSEEGVEAVICALLDLGHAKSARADDGAA